ncbi:MAG: N-acetylmuramic acid 6-phosphate etherase [Gaiellaceae bacterium]
MGLDELITEAGNGARDLDLRSVDELVALMGAEDGKVPEAVAAASDGVARAIDVVVDRLERGGRLVYVGAGTSGRLAAADADECQSTFATAPGQVVALVAGARFSSPLEQEAAEDDADGGASEIAALDISPLDAVVGISASGRSPYVVGALRAAAERGAATIALVCVAGSELGALAEREIAVVVGPELLAGSTRLKAGTAQKLVLNQISTISMIQLGKAFDNLMVDVRGTSVKLRERARRIVATATGAPPEQVDRALAAADGEAKVAIVSLLAGVGIDTARARLARSNGRIRTAIAP